MKFHSKLEGIPQVKRKQRKSETAFWFHSEWKVTVGGVTTSVSHICLEHLCVGSSKAEIKNISPLWNPVDFLQKEPKVSLRDILPPYLAV